jgi:hypothetical protein
MNAYPHDFARQLARIDLDRRIAQTRRGELRRAAVQKSPSHGSRRRALVTPVLTRPISGLRRLVPKSIRP